MHRPTGIFWANLTPFSLKAEAGEEHAICSYKLFSYVKRDTSQQKGELENCREQNGDDCGDGSGAGLRRQRGQGCFFVFFNPLAAAPDSVPEGGNRYTSFRLEGKIHRVDPKFAS
jgi:hypothetical protein